MYYVSAVFLGFFSYGFSQIFPLGIGCFPLPVGSYSEYTECTPFPVFHQMAPPLTSTKRSRAALLEKAIF